MRAARKGTIVFCGAMLVMSAVASAPGATQDASAPVGQSPAENFEIAGTVVDAITGQAIAHARVTLAKVGERGQSIETMAGDDGRFAFAGVPAGKYSLRGARRGYIAATYEEHGQFSTAIVTGPEFATEKLALRLMPTATIAGHVLDESGEPVRSAQVQLFLEDHGQGVTRMLGGGYATTDDRGYFDFGMLRPGKYFAAVSAKPWYAVYPSGESAPEQVPPALEVAYPTTFLGGGTEVEGAESISLKGGERQEIEIRLSPVPTLRLKFHGEKDGRVRTPFLRRPLVDSFPANTQIGEVRSVGQGEFEMVGVPAGRYEVTTENAEGDGQTVSEMNLTRDGQELSELRGETLGKLNLTLKASEGETLPPQLGVAVRNAEFRVMAYQQADAKGKVSFTGLKPGKYGIVIDGQGTPGKRYAVTRTVSASGAVGQGHEVNVATGAEELTAEVAVGEVRIEGVVKKNGKPVAGVMVALVPNDPMAHVNLFRRDQSDFDGSFVLPGVIAGSYTIVAVEDAWGFEWLKAGVLARYVQHGQNVIIGEKMRGKVHLLDAVEVQAR